MSEQIQGATSRMSSREFQERTGRDRRRELQRERRRALLGDDGLVRAEFLEERSCPTCAAADPRVAFRASGVEYAVCGGCGLLYVPRYVNAAGREAIRPRPVVDDEAASPIYLQPLQREFDVPKFERGLELLGECGLGDREAPRVLDVGTGSGLFLEVTRDAGWSAVGLEYGDSLYKQVHEERGLDVLYGAFEELELAPGSFDAVAMWDCLEHVIDPAAALARVRRTLVEDGLLLLLVPNAGSLAARVLHERCAMFDGVEHVNMYTPRTLREFAERCGFACAHLETIIPEINVLDNHLRYEDPYLGSSSETSRALGLEALGEEAILRNDLGYKILAVFRAVAGEAT